MNEEYDFPSGSVKFGNIGLEEIQSGTQPIEIEMVELIDKGETAEINYMLANGQAKALGGPQQAHRRLEMTVLDSVGDEYVLVAPNADHIPMSSECYILRPYKNERPFTLVKKA